MVVGVGRRVWGVGMKIFPRGLERVAAAAQSLLFIYAAAPVLMTPDTCVRADGKVGIKATLAHRARAPHRNTTQACDPFLAPAQFQVIIAALYRMTPYLLPAV